VRIGFLGIVVGLGVAGRSWLLGESFCRLERDFEEVLELLVDGGTLFAMEFVGVGSLVGEEG